MTSTADGPDHFPVASIVIPAHNEEGVLGRLLARLTDVEFSRPFEVLVVCNGCTDNTVEVARSYGVIAIELDDASKRSALRRGDEEAHYFPRLYVDADVEISGTDALGLVDALRDGRLLACAPSRLMPRDGVTPLARWYYDVWERLPAVRDGLFGRGVIALSEEGHERVRDLPPAMSDDLALSEAFLPSERAVIVGSVVVVHPARTIGDLLRRRVRVMTGNVEATRLGLRTQRSRTAARPLLQLGRREPTLLLKVPVLLGVALLAKILSWNAIRRRDFQTWQRDESSRRGGQM